MRSHGGAAEQPWTSRGRALEERLTTAFTGVIATLEAELHSLTSERDDACQRLTIAERKLTRRGSVASLTAANLQTLVATGGAGAQADEARSKPSGSAGSSDWRTLHPQGSEGDKSASIVARGGRGDGRLGLVRRALSFDKSSKRKESKAMDVAAQRVAATVD